MTTPEAFTLTDVTVLAGSRGSQRVCVRMANGRIAALGAPSIAQRGDLLVAGLGRVLLPGLIDGHVHLLPGCSVLAARQGVTTQIDLFSKPEVIEPERALIRAGMAGRGPVAADLLTSSIGATAPGGHPSLAYAPIPYVDGPAAADSFVRDRQREGANHLKIIHDDGSGVMLQIPTLDRPTVEALVHAAHRHGMLAIAHASTAAGAVLMAHCGVDVLAHAPMDRLTEAQVDTLASAAVAVISTLGIADGFPDTQGVMPLLAQPAARARLSPAWQTTIERQGARWMPPEPFDHGPQRANIAALHASGVPIIAGTDVPNPGLAPGISLHRELQHLRRCGLGLSDALAAATSVPATVFGLNDRGALEVGRRADLLLLEHDELSDIATTLDIAAVWVAGRLVGHEVDPTLERRGLVWLQEITDRILAGITTTWSQIEGPRDVTRDDGEVLGRIVPQPGGWQPMTIFGVALGGVSEEAEAIAHLEEHGLAVLAEDWWILAEDGQWQTVQLMEVTRERLKIRWTDPMREQPPQGHWIVVAEVAISKDRPD